VGSTLHSLYKSGSHVQVCHIYQQKTGMQGSRCLLVWTGVNFHDARLIHAFIRVHPGWWLGYLHAAPLGMTFWRSWWATDLSPGDGGFASHRGILTLQFFGTPLFLAQVSSYSTKSGRTCIRFMTSWSRGETKLSPVARLESA